MDNKAGTGRRGILASCVVSTIVLISLGNTASAQELSAANRTPDSCNLRAEPGNCLAYFLKYYYDNITGKCESFVYGGCGGNANRFETEGECLKFRTSCLHNDRKSKPHRRPPTRRPTYRPTYRTTYRTTRRPTYRTTYRTTRRPHHHHHHNHLRQEDVV